MATVRGHGPNRGTFLGAIDGACIWWIAPSYPVAKQIIWPDLRRSLENAAIRISESEHSITLPSGGSVTVKSADNPNSLRGAGLDGAVMDEAAFCEERVWKEVLRPMLSDRQGWATFISSPNGCNWFYELFQSANGEGWERWQKPSSENPLMTKAELAAALREIGPRAYAQEYEAKFTEEAGAVFPVEYFPDSLWFDEWPESPDIKVITCDPSLGKTKLSDYSALVCLAKHEDTYYVSADLEKRPPAKIVSDSLRLHQQFRPDCIGFEAVGFQELLRQDFDDAVDAARMEVWSVAIPCGPVVSKTRRVLRLDAPLSEGRIKFKRGCRGTELLVEQLRGFPLPKYHDDGPDALEMAVRLCEEILRGAVRETSGQEERVYA